MSKINDDTDLLVQTSKYGLVWIDTVPVYRMVYSAIYHTICYGKLKQYKIITDQSLSME